ncbi:hypothetical protein GUJ93_ZPchr0010g8030 [Zizania palustris]|uniref:Uncharacterized protein n=1 Tax=Zizania palustris TaxID=103762 RepID=A0A8J5W7H0_ZIZPA|nr:hypothetical protein GUJ93_ZPchr0010g8030 [Zizania palustris]
MKLTNMLIFIRGSKWLLQLLHLQYNAARIGERLSLCVAFGCFAIGFLNQVFEKKAMEWCASKGNIPYYETFEKEDRNVDIEHVNSPFCMA